MYFTNQYVLILVYKVIQKKGVNYLMANNNAFCSICGKPYHMCMSCKSESSPTPWKMYTDTSEHYKIYQIIHGYNVGIYSKEEAREKFSNVDLSDLNELRDNIKKIIMDILATEETVTKKRKSRKK